MPSRSMRTVAGACAFGSAGGLPAGCAGGRVCRRRNRLVPRFGQKRRRLACAQHRQVDRTRDRAIHRAHLEPTGPQRVVRAREKVEILAARVECRCDGVRQAVGDLIGLAVGDRIQEYRPHVAGEALRVGHPLRVRRPRRVESSAWIVVCVGVDLRRGSRRDVDAPQVEMVVLEQQQLAVAGPRRRREERLRGQRYRSRLGGAGLIADHQLILAARIRQPRDLGPVGRPRRAPIVHAGTRREIPRLSLLGRERVDIAARFERRTHAGRRQDGAANHAGDLLELRTRPRKIGIHVDREPLRLARRGVDEMDVPGLFVDDRVRTGRRAHDVEVVVARQLCDLFAARIVAEEVGRSAAIGEEIHRVADPHGCGVVAVDPRQFLDGVVFEVDQANRDACARRGSAATGCSAPAPSRRPARPRCLRRPCAGHRASRCR